MAWRICACIILLATASLNEAWESNERSPRGWQASLEASEKLLKKVKQTAPAISAGVSNLLTQEDLSWAKIRPKFKSEKQAAKVDDLASQTALLAEKETSFGTQKDKISVSRKELSWDQLLLPGMAIVLVCLLAGYKVGQQNATADQKLHGPASGTSLGLIDKPSRKDASIDRATEHKISSRDAAAMSKRGLEEATCESAQSPGKKARKEGETSHDNLVEMTASTQEEGTDRPAEPEEQNLSSQAEASDQAAEHDKEDANQVKAHAGEERKAGAEVSPAEGSNARKDGVDREATSSSQSLYEGKASAGEDEATGTKDSKGSSQEDEAVRLRKSSGATASTSAKYQTIRQQEGDGNLAPGWLHGAIDSVQNKSGLDAVDSVSVVMEALAARLRLDSDAMSPQERMQLLQMALQCCQHREKSWLSAQANELRQSQADAAQGTLAFKRQQAEAKEARRKVQDLSTYMQDGLLSGLVLMIAVTLFCGVKCGYLGRKLGRCPTLNSLSAPTFWRPWASLDYLAVFWCWAQASSEALLGCLIILGVAYVAVRGGVYQGTTFQAPLLKLGIGLGLICGLAGYLAVGKMGGEANRWLCCWETWVALHLTAAWQLPTLQAALSSEPWKWAKNFSYHACLSFFFPLAIAALPFEGCSYQLLQVRSILSSLFLR